MDNQSGIALVRVGEALPGDGAPEVKVKYYFGDHLGSSSVVAGELGSWINREEYTPYGETSFGSFSRKRFRFTGKERDEESGVYYHGARYYAPWLSRWLTSDPSGMSDGVNLYSYVRNRPTRLQDPTGTQGEEGGGPVSGTVGQEGNDPGTGSVNEVLESVDLHRVAEEESQACLPEEPQVSVNEKQQPGGVGTGFLKQAFNKLIVQGAAEKSQGGQMELRILIGITGSPDAKELLASMEQTTRDIESSRKDLVGYKEYVGALLFEGAAGAVEGARTEILARATEPQEPTSVEPDMHVGGLKRWTIVPSATSRGVDQALRKEIADWAAKYGTIDGPPTLDPVHAGHTFGRSHVFTLPGQPTQVAAQTPRDNYLTAPDERRAAASRRAYNAANPSGPQLPVRPKGSK
jgi:RHS repeat-associated protein